MERVSDEIVERQIGLNSQVQIIRWLIEECFIRMQRDLTPTTIKAESEKIESLARSLTDIS